MGDAVIVFDVDGNCIHVNNSAKNLFQIARKDVENLDTSFAGWNHLMDSDKRKDSKGITTVAWKEKTYQVKADLRRLMDKRNRYMGCFLVIQDRTEEVLRLQKEHFRATHDILTGLYNKEHFYELVGEELEENSEKGYYIICSDIKEFKLINDVFGPKTGDDIIKKVAQVLREKTTQGDIYCRLESDKFGLFVKKNSFDISKFSRYVEEGIKIDSDVSYPVHVYIGIYDIIDTSLPVSVMCDRAFMALKSIKGDYSQKMAYYDESLRESGLLEQKLVGELETALNERQFQIYLQPQITTEGNIHGAEALVRWIHPQKGMIAPIEFIDVFERNGLITKLDEYIWESACIQLKKWKDEGKADMYLSVNISPKDFYYTDLYQVFTGLVEKYDINPKNLNLEITENKERSRKILQMIVALSKQLEVGVIMEGVETEEQLEYLSKIGCDVFQGYYFAKPMQISEFEERYMASKGFRLTKENQNAIIK